MKGFDYSTRHCRNRFGSTVPVKPVVCFGAAVARPPLGRYLGQENSIELHHTTTLDQLIDHSQRLQPHLVVVSRQLLGERPLDALQRIRRPVPSARVVVECPSVSVHDAVTLVKAGATDVVLDADVPRMSEIVGQTGRELERTAEAFSRIITVDPAVRSAMMFAASIARSGHPVLITGETGTGKDLMAHAVHQASGRSGEWVADNVAGLDDTLFSDVLFGHRRGAFTGAIADRKGLAATAHGGTLFLDEIADLAPQSQVKLLRFIEHGSFYPVGSDRSTTVDVRFVLATNRELAAMVAEGSFREDLYYRLAVHQITLPPLRERPHDIPPLVQAFVQQTARELGRPAPEVPGKTIDLLQQRPFPGNVRELRALVINAVTLCAGSVLSPVWFTSPVDLVAAEAWDNDTVAGYRCRATDHGTQVRFPERLPTVSEVTLLLFDEAMRRTNRNQSAAADLLRISASAVNKRARRHTASGCV